MGYLTDCEGVNGGRVDDVVIVSTPKKIGVALRSHRAAMWACDNGALTVWKRDDGFYECSHDRRWVRIEQVTLKTKKAVNEWCERRGKIAMGQAGKE